MYSQNDMIVNAKKRQALIIDQTEHKFSFPVKCELDIFVMTIDNRLNFDKHISAVCNKITVEPRLTTTPFIRPPRYYGHILSN